MARTDYVPYTSGVTLYAKPLPLTTGTWEADVILGVETTTTGDYTFTLTDDDADYRVFERLTGTPLITDTKVGTLPVAGGLDAAGVRSAVGLASADLDTQLADIPTVAEFEARTIVAADYFVVSDYTAPDNASSAAIKAKTDQLTFTVPNKLDVNTPSPPYSPFR